MQLWQTFSSRPPSCATMGENKTHTALKGCGVKSTTMNIVKFYTYVLSRNRGPWRCSGESAHLQPLRPLVRIPSWAPHVEKLVVTCQCPVVYSGES